MKVLIIIGLTLAILVLLPVLPYPRQLLPTNFLQLSHNSLGQPTTDLPLDDTVIMGAHKMSTLKEIFPAMLQDSWPGLEQDSLSVKKGLHIDPLGTLVRHLRLDEHVFTTVIPDPSLPEEDKQLIYDLKERLRASAFHNFIYHSGKRIFPLNKDQGINLYTLRDFLSKELLQGQEADPSRAAAFFNVKNLVRRDPVMALLINLCDNSNLGRPGSAPMNFGGGYTLFPDLKEEDKQLLLDAKAWLKPFIEDFTMYFSHSDNGIDDAVVKELKDYFKSQEPDDALRQTRFSRFLDASSPLEHYKHQTMNPAGLTRHSRFGFWSKHSD